MADVQFTGGDDVGNDKIGNDQIHASASDVRSSVLGSKNVRQTIDDSHQRNSVTVNNNDSDTDQLWRAITSLETRMTILEHDQRNNSRQYWIAIALFIVVIASLWYLSMKIDAYTKAAQNLSRIAAEQRK